MLYKIAILLGILASVVFFAITLTEFVGHARLATPYLILGWFCFFGAAIVELLRRGTSPKSS